MSDATKNAIDVCKKIGKPSASGRELLSKLYPAGRTLKGTKRKFSPFDKSVAESARVKKKAAIPKGRPRTLTVVLLEKDDEKVPRGKKRKELKEKGRLRSVKIHRSAAASEVRNELDIAFADFPGVVSARFLRCSQDNAMVMHHEQSLNGEDIAELAGNGCVYMSEVCWERSCNLCAL